MKLILTLIIGISGFLSFSQSLEISSIAINEEGNVYFRGMIKQNHSDREQYNLLIYSSIDNFRTPIDYTYKDMFPGKTYDITFDGNEQFGKYKGDLQLRFDIIASSFPIKINDPKVLKSGKSIDLSWEDFHNVNSYDIELYRHNKLVQVLANNHSGQTYKGVLPKQLEKGNDYTLLIKPSGNSGSPSDQIPVQIKASVGLAVKLMPVVALGVAVPVFLLGGGSSPPPGKDTTFEDPPGPPGGN